MFSECPVFKSCVSAAELHIALGGAVVQGSEFFVCLSIDACKNTWSSQTFYNELLVNSKNPCSRTCIMQLMLFCMGFDLMQGRALACIQSKLFYFWVLSLCTLALLKGQWLLMELYEVVLERFSFSLYCGWPLEYAFLRVWI